MSLDPGALDTRMREGIFDFEKAEWARMGSSLDWPTPKLRDCIFDYSGRISADGISYHQDIALGNLL